MHDNEHGTGRSLRDYLRILQRRKAALLITLVVLPAVAWAASLQQPVMYEASADVVLSRQNLANALTGTPDPGLYDFERVIETQASLAMSPEIGERVAREVNVRGRTGPVIQSRTTASPGGEVDLLSFAVRDPVPEIAARLANEYARQYIAYRQRLETRPVTDARRQLEAQISSLEREGESEGRLYANLVDKLQQLRTLETLQASNAVVASEATGAAQVQPRTQRNIVLALALALLIGTALALLIEALDTRLRSSDEIGAALGIPLLGRIAAPPRNLRGGGSLVMSRDPTGHRAEAFRLLRMNIELAAVDRRTQTILITSAVEQEGKSTTAANLALAWAQAGRRVLLVDLDLRRPSQQKLRGVSGGVGLSGLALRRATLEEALVPIDLPHRGSAERLGHEGSLELLPAGPPPPNIGEFVGSDRLTQILDDVRVAADVVIIDSPPMLSVSDALTLSRKVDSVLAIVRLESAKRGPIREFSRLLSNAAAPAVGFVVTGAETDIEYAYGADYYAYPSRDPEPEPHAQPVPVKE